MLAVSHGRIETTNLLLNCGADVNIQVCRELPSDSAYERALGYRWVHCADVRSRAWTKGAREGPAEATEYRRIADGLRK